MGSSPLQMQKLAPTRELAEKYLDDHLALSDSRTDANDLLYYVNASRNYNPVRILKASPRRYCGSTPR